MTIIICIILLVILSIALLLKIFFRTKIRHAFKVDKIIQREKDEYQNTVLYKIGRFADPITSKYVSRYTIVTQEKQKSLVVLYDEPMKMIKYYVYIYTLGSKLVEVLEVEERNSNEVSRDIMLPKNCRKINIEVVEINNEVVNKQLKKVSNFNIFIYSFFSLSFVCLFLYILISLFIDESVANNSILEIVSAGLIYFVLLFIYLVKKNGKDVDANGTD